MRVLLTGAAGFIGSSIADHLLARGDEVVGFDLLLPAAHPPGPPQWAPPDLRVADIRDPAAVAAALDGVDVVCHQAAMVGLGVNTDDYPDYLSHNAYGTSVVLTEMARTGVRRFVQASSMVVYGEGAYSCPVDGPVRPGPRTTARLASGNFDPPCPVCGGALVWRRAQESAPLDPRNAYAVSKVTQEQLASAWVHAVGGVSMSLRYHNVYGPRMPRDTPYAGVAAIFRSALESGQAPTVLEDGAQMRDFVHVDDIARANLSAIDWTLRLNGPRAGAVNVCSGHPRSVGDLARQLSTSMAGPAPEVVGGGRPGDVRHIVGDPTAATQILGFRAATDFADGVADFASAAMRSPVPAGQVVDHHRNGDLQR